jgi:hypothetical protein
MWFVPVVVAVVRKTHETHFALAQGRKAENRQVSLGDTIVKIAQ